MVGLGMGRINAERTPPVIPLTDHCQFDILQSGPGWWQSNAIRSIETTRVHHASRRRGCVALAGSRDRAGTRQVERRTRTLNLEGRK